jgi:hypothetical protein
MSLLAIPPQNPLKEVLDPTSNGMNSSKTASWKSPFRGFKKKLKL